MSATASSSSIPPASHARAAGANVVRPAAKPFTDAWRAAAARLSATVSSHSPRPETTIPRHQGSFRATAPQVRDQAALLRIGSSFHQSGRTPRSWKRWTISAVVCSSTGPTAEAFSSSNSSSPLARAARARRTTVSS